MTTILKMREILMMADGGVNRGDLLNALQNRGNTQLKSNFTIKITKKYKEKHEVIINKEQVLKEVTVEQNIFENGLKFTLDSLKKGANSVFSNRFFTDYESKKDKYDNEIQQLYDLLKTYENNGNTKWTKEELSEIAQKLSKIIKQINTNHPNKDIEKGAVYTCGITYNKKVDGVTTEVEYSLDNFVNEFSNWLNNGKIPESGAPGGSTKPSSAPDVSKPQPSTQEVSKPQPSAPGGSTKPSSAPDVSKPQPSAPDVSKPQSGTPGVSKPQSSAPEVNKPQSSAPGGSAKASSAPDVSKPQSSTPEVNKPQPSAPGGSAKASSAPDVSKPQSSVPGKSTKTTSNSTGKTQTGIPPIKKADGNKLDSSHKTNTNTNNNGETMTNDTSNNTSTNTTTNENEVENKETQNENEEKEKSNSFYQFLPLMMMGGMGQNNNMMSMMLPMLMMFGDDNKDMNMEKMMPMMMMSMMGGMGQDNNMMGMMFPMLMMFGDDNKDMDMEQMMPIMMMSMMGGMGNNSMDSVQDTGNITNNVVGSNKGYFDDVFLNLFYPLMFGQQTMSSPLSLPTMYQAVQPLMSVPMAYPMIQQNFFNYGMPMIQQPMMMPMAGYPTMPMMQPMMMPMAGYPTMPMMPTMPAMSTMQPPMNMMGMGGNPMMNMMGNPMMGMGGNPMMNMMGNPLMNWAQQMSGMNGLEDAGKKQIAMTWEIMKDQLSPEQQEQMKKMIKICYGISLDDEEEKKKKKEEEEKKKKEEEEKKKKEEEEKKKKEEEEKKKKEDEERKRRENRISEIEREYNKNKQSKIKDKEQIKQDAKRNKSKRDRLKDSFKRHRKQKALLGINNEDISNIKNNMKRIASKTINIDNRHYGHTHKFVKHLYTRASTKVDNKVLFAIQDYIHLEPGEDDVEAICAKHGITVDHGKKHSVYVLKLIADTIGKDALNQIINTKDKGTDALKQCVKKINLKPIFKNYLKGEQTAEATAARFTENVYDYIINSGNEELINSFLKHYNVQRKTTNKKQSKNNKSLVEENSKLDKAIRDVDADNKRRLVH